MAFDSAYCDELPVANSSLRRFDGRYFSLDFPLTAIGTVVSEHPDNLVVHGECRSNRDLIGLIWESADTNGHPLLQYIEDKDYTGVKLAFVGNPLKPYKFTVSISTTGGEVPYRLYPYKIEGSSVVPDVRDALRQGSGTGLSYSVSELFPAGTPSVPSGSQIYVIDFDNLRAGFNFGGAKIDQTNIRKMFFPITPPSYGLGGNATLRSVGDLRFANPPYLYIEGTGDLTHWVIENVNPDTRLSKGDILNITLTQPDRYVGTHKSKKGAYAIYTQKTETLAIQCDEWYGDGTTTRYIKVRGGAMEGVAFLGGNVVAQSLGRDTAIGSESITFNMTSISVTGARRMIGRRFYPQTEHKMQMTSGFDDTYSVTPYRQVDTTYNLGYRNNFTMYMGMSHYYSAFSTGGSTSFKTEVVKDAEEPLNIPTQEWCKSLFRQMNAYGFKFIWSTAYEILNSYMPEEWKQRDAYGDPALSGWSPPSSFVIPAKHEPLDYLARVIKNGLKLMSESGMTELRFQIGEPWWWDGSYTNGAPCIYDEFTKSLYTSETGNAVPTPYYTNYEQAVTPEQRPYLEWLGTKLGQSTNRIRDSVKAAYPTAKATLLFFSPQIMNPRSEMLPIINFPESEWVYPNYDFMQIEDYDWIINGELDLLPLTFEAATVRLGYPIEVVHYFLGFVLNAYERWVWANVNIANRDAILRGQTELYVWAYPQVVRDGITYDDTLYGTEEAIQPEMTKRRQVDARIEERTIRPVYFCQIGDDTFMNSSDKHIDFDGKTWFATGQFGKIDVLQEGLNAADSGWSMALSNIPLDEIDYVTDHIRAKEVKLYLGLTDAGNVLLSAPRLIGSGSILDNNVNFEGATATMKVNVRSKLSDWNKAKATRYTDEYQQLIHPDDRGFMFVGDLLSHKIEWGQ